MRNSALASPHPSREAEAGLPKNPWGLRFASPNLPLSLPASISNVQASSHVSLTIFCARPTCQLVKLLSLWVVHARLFVLSPPFMSRGSTFIRPTSTFSDWFPNTQPAVLLHQGVRAQISLVSLASWENAMHYCSCSATDPSSSISVPQPSQSVLMIAQTWNSCGVACHILLARQHSSSLLL
jgi:hypothetical protein